MKWIIKTIKTFLFSLLALLIISYIALSIRYSPSYVYRLTTMNVADVYDYQNFENREIKAGNNTFEFAENHQDEYVESLFNDLVKKSGFSSFDEWAEKSQTTALLFIRKDTILYEKYFNGFARDSYFHSQSMAKSFISFLIGAAIDDVLIKSVDDPMTDYIPELKDRDARFEKIKIKDLLEMRSGLYYYEGHFPGTYIHLPWHAEAVGYYHDNLRKVLLEEIEIEKEAGKDFQYNNYNTSYLGMIVERATGKTVSKYLEEKLWKKVMRYDALFSIDSEESGFEYMPSRLIARARDWARFGRLYLNEGRWEDQQIISKDWVIESTREHTEIPREIYPPWYTNGCKTVYYSYQWWGHKNCDGSFQFAASGNLGQNIYVIPHKDIIIVHCGNSLEHYGDFDLWGIADKINGLE